MKEDESIYILPKSLSQNYEDMTKFKPLEASHNS